MKKAASINTVQLGEYLNDLLSQDSIKDASQNGFQIIGDPQARVKKICTAVDAGLSVIEEAIDLKAQVLLVHHGLLWGKSLPVSGIYGEKVRMCVKSGLSLFASHLPVDAHLTLGNSAQLARYFGLTNVKSAFFHGHCPIGVTGTVRNIDAVSIAEHATHLVGASEVRLLDFGGRKVSKIGIVSGGTSSLFDHKEIDDLDLLITGEPRQSNFHDAEERKLNLLFIGHYASETVGVRAVGEHLQKRFGFRHEFIDVPTGI